MNYCDIELNPGPNRLRIATYFISNIRGLYGKLGELAVISIRFDIICCAEALVSDMRYLPVLLLSNFNKPFEHFAWSPRVVSIFYG